MALTLLGWAAGAALADGDPASDVLATQTVFIPWDAGLSATQQAQLAALLTAAQRARVPVRLAIIASPADLGSVAALWRQPQRYATYLGEELSLVYRGPLLALMPDGLGVYDTGRPLTAAESAAAESAAAEVPAAGSRGARLLRAAVAAVRRLAAASGHPLAVPGAAVRTHASPAGVARWLAVAFGAALIAAAWVASLRTRPLRLRSPW